MVESQVWTLINNFVIVLVCAKCLKLITLEENMISLQQFPLCFPWFFAFFLGGSWHWHKKFCGSFFFKMQFLKKVLIYVFGVFIHSFCNSFYEGFIHKIISLYLPFICISYPLKFFKFDTRILRDSYAVPLLKTLNRLPQSIAFLCLILFLMVAWNNYPFCAFVTMIYWTSTEVL